MNTKKTRQFLNTTARHARQPVISKLTGLIPSSPSLESILSLPDEPNVLRDVDYSKLLYTSVPDLQTHVDQNHDQFPEPLVHCPWCNHHFFEWLIDNGHFSFVGIIENESVDDPHPEFQSLMSDAYLQANPHLFQHFIPRVKTKKALRREKYRFNKTLKWKIKSKVKLVEILAKTAVETAENPEQDRFKKLPRSQDVVREWVAGNCHYNSEDLETYPAHNNLFVLPSARYLLRPNVPRYLFMRFDNVIPNEIQDLIWKSWCKMRDKLFKFERKQNRDTQPQLHLGIWQHYRQVPYIISDTIRQTLGTAKDVEKFMNLIRLNIAWRLWALLQRYDPETFARVMRVRDYYKSDATFMENLLKVPHADFGGIFYAIAVKEGGSQKVHLDWLDHVGTYAWVITIGPGWTGGDLCFPQLGKKVPTQPGQVVAFQGRYLAHCASPNTGKRLVITCFTDRNLMNKALAALEDRIAQSSQAPIN